MRYGAHCVSFNGCELIAVYNALLNIGEGRSLYRIIRDAESLKGLVWGIGAIFGTHPDRLGRLFDLYGVRYVMTKKRGCFGSLLSKRGTYIVSFWTGKRFLSSIHTVMFTAESARCIEVYNFNGNKKAAQIIRAAGEMSPLDVLLSIYGKPIVLYKIIKRDAQV